MTRHTDPNAAGPLILTHRARVLALEPATGKKLWDLELGASARRLFRVEGVLFVTYGTFVCFVDLASGKLLGHHDLGFNVTAGFVRDRHVFLAGDGAACLDWQGRIVWRVVTTERSGWVREQQQLSCLAPDGTELWSSEPLRRELASDNTGLLLGDAVAQPDIRD